MQGPRVAVRAGILVKELQLAQPLQKLLQLILTSL
jgi:hypothetical protein